MNTVKVSKKYQVVIPEDLRQKAHIKAGDRMIVIAKHGILQYIPLRAIKETKGMILGLDVKDLRDKTDRI